MFHTVGVFVARAWPVLLGAWAVGLLLLALLAPSWEDVTDHGQQSFLPADVPSNRGQVVLAKAFSQGLTRSSIVIVLRRADEPLRDEDKSFIQDDLEPALDELAFQGGTPEKPDGNPAGDAIPATDNPGARVTRIETMNSKVTGRLLVSRDKKAAVAMVELTTQLQDRRSWLSVKEIEHTIEKLRRDNKVPQGLEVGLTGSAVVGRDIIELEKQSAAAIEKWTVVFVIVLLLVIYRAPLVAIIPLLTVFVAVHVSIKLLSLMADHGLVDITDSIRIYITILAYGAGVDYCLFLTARFREEMERGQSARESLIHTIGKVGEAITASAGTVIAGIGMLALCRFGRYHQAGISIPFSLVFVLLCTLTFTAALLFLAGRWSFWPGRLARELPAATVGVFAKQGQSGSMFRIWHWIGEGLHRRPGIIWLTTVAVLLPFAIIGVIQYDRWDYGLITSLPARTTSVQGTHIVEEHFSRGLTATVTVVLHNDAVEFRSAQGRQAMAELTERLKARKDELRIADVRTLAAPTGITAAANEAQAELEALDRAAQIVLRERAAAFYVSDAGELEGQVARMDVVMTLDPLSQAGIEQLRPIEAALRAELPDLLRDSEVHVIGATAGLRDLQDVTTGDLRRIEILVPLVILIILIIVLREIVVSVYLIVSVLFSYLVTLGMTYVAFWALSPATFTGLDWKVPILLFAILVAVGEDYNIFLMTRVREERAVHGPIRGVIAALVKTGGIISSCGFIMAGTFVSLLTGSLIDLKELGFALAVGVLLDTLVVRPILVPAFLVLMQRRRPGAAQATLEAARAAR